MKKQIAMLLCLLTAGFSLAGCSMTASESEPPPEMITTAPEESSNPASVEVGDEGKTYTMGDGTVIMMTDDGTMITKTEAGFEWNYLSGTVRITFPPAWEDRFTVDGTSVYCKACYDASEGSGELFSLDFCDDKGMITGPHYTALLGQLNKMYVTAMLPDDPKVDQKNGALYAEYMDLASGLTSVFSSAVCVDSPDFVPILLDGFRTAAEEPSKLAGYWLDSAFSSEDGLEFYPYAVFRERDSAFGYKYGPNDLCFGTFLVNIKAKDYMWNTDNWGDAGLVFAGNCAYRVTYFETAPMTLKFDLLLGNPATDMLSSKTFAYERDYQQIHQSDGSDQEVELT